MKKMKSIKLLPDYECFPLWHHESEEIGCINPSELGISTGLVGALNAWQEKYDNTLKRDDPAQSGFQRREDQNDFVREGYELGLRLKDELKDKMKVLYYDISENEKTGTIKNRDRQIKNRDRQIMQKP